MAKISRVPNYSDLDLDFLPHPTTGDVVKKTGVDAIKRSIRNLVLTNFYDRKFRSWIGSNAQKLLFENPSPLAANFLKDAIRQVVENFEPRAQVPDGGIIVDLSEDNNGYNATIYFLERNRMEPASVSVFLKRLR